MSARWSNNSTLIVSNVWLLWLTPFCIMVASWLRAVCVSADEAAWASDATLWVFWTSAAVCCRNIDDDCYRAWRSCTCNTAACFSCSSWRSWERSCAILTMLDRVCRCTGDLFFCSLKGSGVADSNVGIAIASLLSLLVLEAAADCDGDLCSHGEPSIRLHDAEGGCRIGCLGSRAWSSSISSSDWWGRLERNPENMLPKNRRVYSVSSVMLVGTRKSTRTLLESLQNLLWWRGYQSGGSNRSAKNGVRPKCVLDRSVKVSIRYNKFSTLLESCPANALS